MQIYIHKNTNRLQTDTKHTAKLNRSKRKGYSQWDSAACQTGSWWLKARDTSSTTRMLLFPLSKSQPQAAVMSQPNHVTKQLYPDTNHHTTIQSIVYCILHTAYRTFMWLELLHWMFRDQFKPNLCPSKRGTYFKHLVGGHWEHTTKKAQLKLSVAECVCVTS